LERAIAAGVGFPESSAAGQEDTAMVPRIAKASIIVLAAVLAGVFCPGSACSQQTRPLQLFSIEAIVAESAVVVRGVVVDVADADGWNLITVHVRETLKGTAAKQVRFAAPRLAKLEAALGKAKQSQRELLCLLQQQKSGPGEAPQREKVLAQHHVDLYAPFVPGRPGKPALPVIAVGPPPSDEYLEPPAFLDAHLQIHKTPEALDRAIRTAIAAPFAEGACYELTIPRDMAQRSGFSREHNLLTLPIDRRLEALARRLLRSPGDFAAGGDSAGARLLRLEGIKALRLFPGEANLAMVRAWLDDPTSTAAYTEDRKTQTAGLVPTSPANRAHHAAPSLPDKLEEVPEIHFQRPLTRAMSTEDAHLHTAVTIDCVDFLNRQKTDGFVEALIHARRDLAGLSFAMGDACRMKPEAGRQFITALEVFREAQQPRSLRSHGPITEYKSQSAAKKIDPTASVAALMQVLAPEDARIHLGLVEYLGGVMHIDATRALAKLAIFSQEREVRDAAVAALKLRDRKDYSKILSAGLQYPWPAVAEWSSRAIAELKCEELIPQLIEVLEKPDPRAPQTQQREDQQVSVVRELVRLNHHHNCLLCHAPGPRTGSSTEDAAPPKGLTAQVPVPTESLDGYNRFSRNPDILVRIDVTYLRQDFSIKLPVADAKPWPDEQRYDFLVRTREVTDEEARTLQKLLDASQVSGVTPYRRAAHSALRALTGMDAGPTAAAWRWLTKL
jgi:hypothetical protein